MLQNWGGPGPARRVLIFVQGSANTKRPRHRSGLFCAREVATSPLLLGCTKTVWFVVRLRKAANCGAARSCEAGNGADKLRWLERLFKKRSPWMRIGTPRGHWSAAIAGYVMMMEDPIDPLDVLATVSAR